MPFLLMLTTNMSRIDSFLTEVLDRIFDDSEDKDELIELFPQAIQFLGEEIVANEFMTEEESNDYCDRIETAFQEAIGDDNEEEYDRDAIAEQLVDVPYKLLPPPRPPKRSKSATTLKWVQDPAELRAAAEYANAFR